MVSCQHTAAWAQHQLHIWKNVWHWFIENVFSMSQDDLAAFDVLLGVRPYLLDAKHFTSCGRPRLYWCSWQLSPFESVRLIQLDFYVEVVVAFPRQTWLVAGLWLDLA